MRWGLNFIGNQDCNWSPADKGGACQFFFSPLHFSSLPLSLHRLHFASWSLPGYVEGQGQCRVVQYRVERKGRKDRKRRGGRIWRQRKGGILEIKSSGERESRVREEDRKEGQSERELKVSVRTVWSSELDRDTAAVTSVLISPSAGWWDVS